MDQTTVPTDKTFVENYCPIQKLPIIVNLDYYYKDTNSFLNAAQTPPAVVKHRVGQEHESIIQRDCRDILCTLRRDLRGVQLIKEDAQKIGQDQQDQFEDKGSG